MVMADSPEFVTAYLAAMRIGAVPVPVSTMMRADGLAELLADSRPRLAAVSPAYRDPGPSAGVPWATEAAAVPRRSGSERRRAARPRAGRPRGADELYPTTADSPAFWLYTSGTTGMPKAAMHRHGSIRVVCETYGAQVLGIPPRRPVPVRRPRRSSPTAWATRCCSRCRPARPPCWSPRRPVPTSWPSGLRSTGATLFFAGPTFFANRLRAGAARGRVPACGWPVGRRGRCRPPVPPVDRRTSAWTSSTASASTEMLHIFLSNRPGDGQAGHDRRGRARLRPARSWTRTGGGRRPARPAPSSSGATPPPPGTGPATGLPAGVPGRVAAHRRHLLDADGYYACLGRTGDMLKASGMWVSPAEVEAGCWHTRRWPRPSWWPRPTPTAWKAGRLRPAQPGRDGDEDELIEFCRAGLPSFKRPRKVVFLNAYPTTAPARSAGWSCARRPP